MAYEACRLALTHMTPVILLSDGFIANGAEPWKLPRIDELPPISISHHTEPDGFEPYQRDPRTLARPWAVPGTPGLEHRIGGLEKAMGSGAVSYDPANHEQMVKLRQEKVDRVADDIPLAEVTGDPNGDLLVIGWGSTYGAITSAVRRARQEGQPIAQLHLRHLNPLPSNLGDILDRFPRVLIPEINMGQLALVLRARYLKPIISLTKEQGTPFASSEVLQRIEQLLETEKHEH
jgi:2-oxoglutarate ferredoxin oxidoreductase subunit alpha